MQSPYIKLTLHDGSGIHGEQGLHVGDSWQSSVKAHQGGNAEYNEKCDMSKPGLKHHYCIQV
jgi:hypothetical protein